MPVQQIWVDMAEGDETQSLPFEAAAEVEIAELIRALYSGTDRGRSHPRRGHGPAGEDRDHRRPVRAAGGDRRGTPGGCGS